MNSQKSKLIKNMKMGLPSRANYYENALGKTLF